MVVKKAKEVAVDEKVGITVKIQVAEIPKKTFRGAATILVNLIW